MLNPEVAQAQLGTVYVADWRGQRLKQMGNLPEALQSIGYGILGYGSDGRRLDNYQSYSAQQAELYQLDVLAPSEREQIISVIFPKFAALVEAGWQLISQLPYQSDSYRRSFHSPTHPELSASKRREWLSQLIHATQGYDRDLEWFAAWVPYLNYYAATDTLGILFAAAINQDDALGQTIFDILTASASGNHEVGAMGRHVTRALLVANRVDGWEFMERLLLAAQRQEGLRQTILETIDEAHPIAFRRMLRLIVEQNLTRFSATIRAVDVWLGFGLESLNEKLAKQMLSQILEILENPDAQAAALESEDAQTVYLALWSAGFEDAIAAVDLAIPLLNHPQAEHRFVAVHFLAQLNITPARSALLLTMGDRNLEVATCAVQALSQGADPTIQYSSDAFERLERALPNFPVKPKALSIVWEWIKLEPSQNLVASAMVHNLGQRSPKRLISYLPLLAPSERYQVAKLLSEIKPWDDEVRAVMFDLVRDTSSWVRDEVIKLLQLCSITLEESVQLEQLLTRQASDLRRGILGLLLNQPDEVAIASAERLLPAKKALQRQAGLELLRELVQQNRWLDRARSLATEYQANRSKLTVTETQLLKGILQTVTEPTLIDALGLVQLADLTPIATPQVSTTPIFTTPAAIACLSALDELVHEHRQTPVKVTNWRGGEEEELLGNLSYKFPYFNSRLSPDENLSHLPLSDVWQNWWHDRSDALCDADKLELLRAIVPRFVERTSSFELQSNNESPTQPSLLDRTIIAFKTRFGQELPLRYQQQVDRIVRWLLYLHPPTGIFDFLLNAIAEILNAIPLVELDGDPQWHDLSYGSRRTQINDFVGNWISFTRSYQSLTNAEQVVRWWHLVRWFDRFLAVPIYHIYRQETTLWDVFNAHQAGGATKADVMFYLLGAEDRTNQDAQTLEMAEAKANLRTFFRDLSELTRRKVPESYAAHPLLLELSDRARQRILAIELQRGDLPTAASNAARALRSITGLSTVIRLIQTLDDEKLVRNYTYNSPTKASVFSHLMRISFPAADDTPAEFALQVKSAQIKPKNLIEFAFYAPQWANYVEKALGWDDFAEAVWWFHAHTKDDRWTVEADIRETWVAQISERTPLAATSLVDGAVDVEWFHRLYKTLKADRWQQLYEAAQYASSGLGHQRAKLFADAMLGKLEPHLRDRITQKRHQDAVRALGLLPLPRGKKRNQEILDRYQVMQDFLRTSKKFGSQRQASEKLAVAIGMEKFGTHGWLCPSATTSVGNGSTGDRRFG